MKTNKITFSIVMATMLFISCKKEEIVPGENMPVEVKTYITTHYPSQSIIGSDLDLTDSVKTYEVKLSNSTSLEFNYKKKLKTLMAIPNCHGLLSLV